MSFRKELEDAIKIARGAGDILLQYYRKGNYSVQSKEDMTLVTDADLTSNAYICNALAARYPYPILSEEAEDDPSARMESDYLWLVDPLDGTEQGFVGRTGEFSVVIGLAHKGAPVLGVVYRPTTDELWYAERGAGAYVERGRRTPQRIRVSTETNFDSLRVVVGRKDIETPGLVRAVGLSKVEQMGSFALKACSVAERYFDCYIRVGKRQGGEWDVCAPEGIASEAGGVMSDLRGGGFSYNKRDPLFRGYGGVIVCNRVVHPTLVACIATILHDAKTRTAD